MSAAVVSRLASSAPDGSSATFAGTIDPVWCIGSVPNGGYSLSIVTNAAQAFMRLDPLASSHHFDPLHLSATYFIAVTLTDYTVEVKLQKRGRGLSHVYAELKQKDAKGIQSVRLAVQFIMTDFSSRKSEDGLPTLQPDSPFYYHCPIATPSQLESPSIPVWAKNWPIGQRFYQIRDPELSQKAQTDKKLETGAWIILKDEDDTPVKPQGDSATGLSTANNLVPFFADMTDNSIGMVPEFNARKGMGLYWFPTLHLAIEFKSALPYDRTLTRAGIIARGASISHGQHEIDAEVWSFPEDSQFIPNVHPAAKHQPQLLCIARQIALCVPMSVNQSRNPGHKSKI